MAAYGVGITPLFQLCKSDARTKSVAFADDLSGAEILHDLREFWDNVTLYGPLLGYYPKANKSWLVVKEDQLEEARKFYFTEILILIEIPWRKPEESLMGPASMLPSVEEEC